MGRPHRVHWGKEPVSQHKKILDNSEDSTDNVKLEKIDIPYV